MIFPADQELCTKCGTIMSKTGTQTAPPGIYFSFYLCECGHKLTVARDMN